MSDCLVRFEKMQQHLKEKYLILYFFNYWLLVFDIVRLKNKLFINNCRAELQRKYIKYLENKQNLLNNNSKKINDELENERGKYHILTKYVARLMYNMGHTTTGVIDCTNSDTDVSWINILNK